MDGGESRIFDPAEHPASVQQVVPGLYSIIMNNRSYQAHVAPHRDGFEVWVGLDRFVVSLGDPRDRASNRLKSDNKGPVEVRAQMPGKIVKHLVEVGASVTAGQGLMVVEAMKMQNEVKSPKDGKLKRIYVPEGGTVTAGDALLIVE